MFSGSRLVLAQQRLVVTIRLKVLHTQMENLYCNPGYKENTIN